MYDSNYMTFEKRQNYGDIKSISVCQGFREERRINRQSTEGLWSLETTLCGMSHVIIIRLSGPQFLNRNGNHGLWRLITCWWSSSAGSVYHAMWDIDFEGSCVLGVRAGYVWELSILSAQFFCEPKTFL